MTHGARAFSGLFFAVLSLSSLLAGQQTGATLALPSTGVPRVIQFNGSWSGAKSGIVGFTFAIYKDQEGGAPLWMETQNLQLDGKGHYTALLALRKRKDCRRTSSPRVKRAGSASPLTVKRSNRAYFSSPYLMRCMRQMPKPWADCPHRPLC